MPEAPLATLSHAPRRAAVITDFDGSLSTIVDDPAAAVAHPGAVAALTALSRRVATVAVVSGRPVAFLAAAFPVPGLVLVGQYGVERLVDGEVVVDPGVEPYLDAVAEAARKAEERWPGLHIERKGRVAMTLHWRAAPDAGPAAAAWAEATGTRLGLEVVPGRMAREFRPPVAIDKGTAVEELIVDREVACFAGDDHGDLAAFDALDRAEHEGRLVRAVRIGVRSAEAPPELLTRADALVEGPAGLVALFTELAMSIS